MNSNNLNAKQIAQEIYKCKSNILYFIDMYCKIPESGGHMDYKLDGVNKKLKRYIRSTIKYRRSIMMASRQLGKSTCSGIILLWSTMFFPGNRAVILNMKKQSAIENLKIIKFVHEHLPPWLKVPLRYKGERKTFIEFINNSSIYTFYVSAATPPEQIARGMTVPIIVIDECAFISKIADAYGAATPAISKAREQAIRNGYPTFTSIISTPNGTVGDGEFFYKMYTNASDSDEVFNDEDEKFIDNVEEVLDDPHKNGFIKIDYLWHEDPTKDEKWFINAKKDLNFDTRRINQEINCLFVGSTGCIFDDDLLSLLVSKKPKKTIKLPYFSKLNIFRDFDPLDYVVVGIDTAKSLTK